MKKLTIFSILIFSALQLFASGNPDAILGVWSNRSNKGHIQIYKHNDKYYGKLIWLKEPNDEKGHPKTDYKNPDKTLRNRYVMGLVILRHFRYDDNEWKGGRIYNPNDGKEYKCYMKLKNSGTLTVRGYIGISLFGMTETFTRVR